MEVLELADDTGSTAHIIEQASTAPAGTQWAIGTEHRLVHWLQQQCPKQTIMSLADIAPYCTTMSQTTVQNWKDLLEALSRDELVNEVVVDTETTGKARIALEGMLTLGEK